MQARLEQWLAAWVDLMTRRAGWVLLLGAVITLLGGWYSVTHLAMDTDDSDLISKEVPWRQDYIAYQNAFPVYTDNLVIVVDGATPDLASAATKRLAGALRDQPGLFKSVYVPGGGEFFARNGLLYLKSDKLNDLADRLTQIQPFLGRLSSDPTLVTFFDLLGQAMAPDAPVQLSLSPVFGELADVFDASRAGQFSQMSWQNLMGGDQPGVSDQRFIIVAPKLDYDALLPATAPMQAIRDTASRLNLDAEHGVRVRQTGEIALSNEELQSVTQGAAWGAIAALLAVGIILYLGLRSWALMGASLASLVAGLVGTATFAALFVGRLNLISIAFAVLYIGLGIDYAIHVCLRYREAARTLVNDATTAIADRGRVVRQALRIAISDVGLSLALCAFTTAGGFFAFIPTAYSGVAELGLISGVGMFISLLVSMTFLPAALTWLKPSVAGPMPGRRGFRAPFIGAGAQRIVWVVAVVLALGCAAALPFIHFNSSTLDLKDPNSQSVKTYRDLLAHSQRSPLTLVTTRPTLAAANGLADRFEDRPHIKGAMTIDDYVPANQDDKLATIGDLALTMALMKPDMSQRADFAARRDAIDQFADALAEYRQQASGSEAASAARLSKALSAWRAWFKQLSATRQHDVLSSLHDRVLGGFAAQVTTLADSLKAQRITQDDLPAAIRHRWIGQDGSYRVEVQPSGDLEKTAALKAFVTSAQQVDPDITGAPVLQLAAGRTVSHAFIQAFIYAGLFITLFLLALLRSVVDTLRVLAPLVLSGLILSATTVWLGIPFNFANVIALPLLLGVGVDSGIHVVHRLRRQRAGGGPFLATSTARAVVLSSLTTMTGFGSLAFSHHAGTASMGQLLAIGMVAILVTTLIVVPALFRVLPSAQDKEGN